MNSVSADSGSAHMKSRAEGEEKKKRRGEKSTPLFPAWGLSPATSKRKRGGGGKGRKMISPVSNTAFLLISKKKKKKEGGGGEGKTLICRWPSHPREGGGRGKEGGKKGKSRPAFRRICDRGGVTICVRRREGEGKEERGNAWALSGFPVAFLHAKKKEEKRGEKKTVAANRPKKRKGEPQFAVPAFLFPLPSFPLPSFSPSLSGKKKGRERRGEEGRRGKGRRRRASGRSYHLLSISSIWEKGEEGGGGKRGGLTSIRLSRGPIIFDAEKRGEAPGMVVLIAFLDLR